MRIQSFSLISLCVFSWIALLMTGCGKSESAIDDVPEYVPEIKVTSPQHETLVITTRITGALEANRSSMVNANAEGQVDQVLVDIGDKVNEGDVLLVLRQVDFELAVERARKAVEVTEANLKYILAGDRQEEREVKRLDREIAKATFSRAESRYRRMRQLYEEGVISLEEFEETEEEYKTALAEWEKEQQQVKESEAGPTSEEIELAQAEYNRALSALEEALQDRKDSIVKAPFTGKISAKMVETGERITESTPLFEILDLSMLKAKLFAPETIVGLIQMGMNVPVSIKNKNTEAIEGKVTRINPQIDTETHTFMFELTIPNTEETLKSGLFVTAEVPREIMTDALVLPRAAVIESKGLSFIYRIENDVATMQQIQTGVKTDDWIQLLEDIPPDTRVAAGSIDTLTEGQKVKVLGEWE